MKLLTMFTSHFERQNLTIRKFMKRFNRLALGFSKKRANLWVVINLHLALYNLFEIHCTLKLTPAMRAGVTDRLWSLSDFLNAEGGT